MNAECQNIKYRIQLFHAAAETPRVGVAVAAFLRRQSLVVCGLDLPEYSGNIPWETRARLRMWRRSTRQFCSPAGGISNGN